MPKITFSIDNETGESSLKIEGIKGTACRPIHDAFGKALGKALGLTETHSEDTPEMREVNVRAAQVQQHRRV